MSGPVQAKTNINKAFKHWANTVLWPQARKAKIRKSIFDAAILDVTLRLDLPDLILPGQKRPRKRHQSQAEFRSASKYFNENNLRAQAARGRKLYQQWSKTLKAIHKQYGVPGRFLLAIWARESAFGRAKLPYDSLDVLATKAFLSTRSELFVKELLALLKMRQNEGFGQQKLASSWAGALGQPQFMPTSFLKYAVDFDGDGRKDIWHSVPDILASMANYLKQSGWRSGRDWGFEIRIPAQISCAQEGVDRAKTTTAWAQLGIKRISGRPFPAQERRKKTMMLVPAGRFGPQFVVTENFYVIKTYNNSDLYALYVGNLADRIAYGSGKFVAGWQKQARMLRSDVAHAQRNLEAIGYDVGGADGLVGFKTRRAMGEWQQSKGLSPTCYPTPKLIAAIIRNP